nr:immunoglobulin light chain junction region [Macaca mulatta]MOV95717.1 immunoglobulin light chain junction region [Macaca mulatta]MOV97788.1 immunoglobulin light chain junction region [Macaca mulatta]MOV98382.1 immunoglobulin light chain junction region [Macaca mulatta]MOV98581.1 immunoglobulin light chain junction region [Macaca mulatta]
DYYCLIWHNNAWVF